MGIVAPLPAWVQAVLCNPLNVLLCVVLLHVVRAAARPWTTCLTSPSRSSTFMLLCPTPAEAKLRSLPGYVGAAVGPFARPPPVPRTAGGGGFHGGDVASDAHARQAVVQAGAEATRARWRNYLRRLARADEHTAATGCAGARREVLLAARTVARTRTGRGVWGRYPPDSGGETPFSSLPAYHPTVSVWRRYTPRTLALFDGAGLVLSAEERARVADPRRDARQSNPHLDATTTTAATAIATAASHSDPDSARHIAPAAPAAPAVPILPAATPTSGAPTREPEQDTSTTMGGAAALPAGHPPVPIGAGATQCPGLAQRCPGLAHDELQPAPVGAGPAGEKGMAPAVQEPAAPSVAAPALASAATAAADVEMEPEDLVGGYCGPTCAVTGSGGSETILIGINGRVYDVSSGRAFYGPGGPYASFAGRDATLGLAKNSFDADVLPPLTAAPLHVPLGAGGAAPQTEVRADADVDADADADAGAAAVAALDLTKAERYSLSDWIDMFESKYGVVGELVEGSE